MVETLFENLKTGLVKGPSPIIGTETIQILLLRTANDYVALRTEDTKELNTVVLPRSIKEEEQIERVVMLASKQKAVETRAFRAILNTIYADLKIDAPDCYLKDNLCLECPRCILFGAVKTEGNNPNIKHRIEYSSAFSLQPVEDIREEITFNSVSDESNLTGQALGTIPVVKPGTMFASIITLRSVSPKELLLILKMLMVLKSYGAETRTRGDMKNEIIAITAGWEEIITPLEFTLELSDRVDKEINIAVEEILKAYQNKAAFKEKLTMIVNKDLATLLKSVKDYSLTEDFMTNLEVDVKKFREIQSN